jgi:hypothetical protein
VSALRTNHHVWAVVVGNHHVYGNHLVWRLWWSATIMCGGCGRQQPSCVAAVVVGNHLF